MPDRGATGLATGSAAMRFFHLLVAASVIGGIAYAREPGPESGLQIESIERARAEAPKLVEECRKLTDEVTTLSALLEEHDSLKAAGDIHMSAVTLPGSSALMFDRIQQLKREIRQLESSNPGDPSLIHLKEEHNRLHENYIARMNVLIAGDDNLARRGVSDYHSLVARYGKTRQEWASKQSRYPQAMAAQHRVCEQSRGAQDIIAAGSCDIFNLDARTTAPPRVAARANPRRPDLFESLLGIGAAHAIGTAPGEIAAYAKGTLGRVCVKRRGTSTWARLAQGGAVDVGDTVRTGDDGRARLEFADRDESADAGPSVLNLSPESEVVIERFSITERESRRREGLIELIRGEIRSLMKGWGSSSSVNVKAGVALCGIRGTDFVLSHAPESGRVELMVSEGKVEFSTPQGKTLVGAGQQVTAVKAQISPVTAIPAGAWNHALAAIEVGKVELLKGITNSGTRAQSTPQRTPPQAPYLWGCAGQSAPCVTVRYAGRDYETAYHRVLNAYGIPVDAYYYPLLHNAQPVRHNGEPVWQRFERVPAADHADQSNVQMYHVTRYRKGQEWALQEAAGVRFEVMMTAPHVQGTQPPPTRSPPAMPPEER